MSDSHPASVPPIEANSSTMQGRSVLARTVHDGDVLRALVVALMFAGCVIPPSLSVDTTDAALNAAPSILSVRSTDVELPEGATVSFETGDTLNLTVYDTDVDDTLYCKVFVNYNNPEPQPARGEGKTAGTTVTRTCTIPLAGLCQLADVNRDNLMQVVVFDREPLTTGESPLYQAMPAGGLSATRTYLLKCTGS
jgi:hypothetical protein